MRADRFDLPLRIVVVDPVPDFHIVLQRGASATATTVAPTAHSEEALAFDLDIAVDGAQPDGRPRLLGLCVQGPPKERFVYLCVAPEPGSAGGGRMKIPLGGLTWDLIEALPPGGRLEGRVSGQGRKGGPALATVPILPPGWLAVAP